jgi:hypothetical protein
VDVVSCFGRDKGEACFPFVHFPIPDRLLALLAIVAIGGIASLLGQRTLDAH